MANQNLSMDNREVCVLSKKRIFFFFKLSDPFHFTNEKMKWFAQLQWWSRRELNS